LNRSQRGAALVEFALLTPLLMLILIGLIEIGRFTYFAILVGNAAHAGAAYGAQDLKTAGDATGIQNAVLNDGQNVSGLAASPAPTTLIVCWNGTTTQSAVNDACTTAGYHPVEYVQASATGRFSTIVKWQGLPQSMNLTRQASIRVEIDQ
jgi:Flp pilus assembly protein TadG